MLDGSYRLYSFTCYSQLSSRLCIFYTFSFDWHAKMHWVPGDFWALNGSQRVKYLHPVSILIKIGVLVRKKCVQKCLFFSLVKKRFPPLLVNDNESGPSEGPLRGRMIFCYHVNGFLTVCLLSEIFIYQNSNFQGENCPKKCNFWPKLPPLMLSAGFC